MEERCAISRSRSCTHQIEKADMQHYGNRSFGNASSAASTTSNLAAPPINSGQPSPESEDMSTTSVYSLPDGASPAVGSAGSVPMSAGNSLDQSPTAAVVSSIPANPSPLSQSVTKAPLSNSGTKSTIHADPEMPSAQAGNVAAPQPIPAQDVATPGRPALPAGAATPQGNAHGASTPSSLATPIAAASASNKDLKNQKSGKELAKDAKAAEKAEKAEAAKKAKEAEEKRRADWEKAQKAKAEAKAKEKEDKKKAKKEKGGLSGLFGLGGKKDKEKDRAPGQGQVPKTAQQVQPPRQPQQTQQGQPGPNRQQQQSPVQAGSKVGAPTGDTPVEQTRPQAVRQPSEKRPTDPTTTAAGSQTAETISTPTKREGAKPFPTRPASQLLPPTAVPQVEPRQRNAGSLPNDRLAPKATAGNSAEAKKEEKRKLGFFGTIRRRFSSNPSTATTKSVQASEQRPPVPPVPTNAQSLGRSQAPPPAPAKSATPPTPPKTPAVARPIPQIAGPGRSTPQDTPVAQADLPPRSTSVRGSPANLAPAQLATPPAAGNPNTPPPGGKENGISPSPSPLSRTRGSIKGPRPMPRPTSIASGTASSPKEQHNTSSSFPFHKPSADHIALMDAANQHELAATESSGLSQVPSHFTSSEGTEGYEHEQLGTPLSSEDGARERDVRIEGQDSEADAGLGRGATLAGGVDVGKDGEAVRVGSGDTVRMVVAQ